MDTTLSALFPGQTILLAGEYRTMRPVILAELPLVQRCLEAWTRMVASGGEMADPEAWDIVLGLLAGSLGASREWVDTLPSEDFERLLSTALALNKELLEGGEPGPSSDHITWSRLVSTLVEAGHPWEQIQRMTIHQAREFLAEAARQAKERLALDITASSFAMADGKTVAKVTEELRRE